ncbi:phage tail assembly chaperone [Aurantiacibacter sp. MUD61]|uniref:phage tail assembly chaperone n=1 Tax=Aurantiacibacter sp. MUD61 TaxID=3009083 RepID=UPI0022F0A6EF|nr:phage tail assembly chaperone [Aurantiacibacter sp. MUD61]
MTKQFADSARRLAGASGRLLGWPPHWFWRATPAELAAILLDEANEADPGITRSQIEHMIESDKNGR